MQRPRAVPIAPPHPPPIALGGTGTARYPPKHLSATAEATGAAGAAGTADTAGRAAVGAAAAGGRAGWVTGGVGYAADPYAADPYGSEVSAGEVGASESAAAAVAAAAASNTSAAEAAVQDAVQAANRVAAPTGLAGCSDCAVQGALHPPDAHGQYSRSKSRLLWFLAVLQQRLVPSRLRAPGSGMQAAALQQHVAVAGPMTLQQAVADRLALEAFNRGSMDNIAVVVMDVGALRLLAQQQQQQQQQQQLQQNQQQDELQQLKQLQEEQQVKHQQAQQQQEQQGEWLEHRVQQQQRAQHLAQHHEQQQHEHNIGTIALEPLARAYPHPLHVSKGSCMAVDIHTAEPLVHASNSAGASSAADGGNGDLVQAADGAAGAAGTDSDLPAVVQRLRPTSLACSVDDDHHYVLTQHMLDVPAQPHHLHLQPAAWDAGAQEHEPATG